MIIYWRWICLAAAAMAIALGSPTIAQETRPAIKYYAVANTVPPDAFLALRTAPSSKLGSRIGLMSNGTVLEVLKTTPNGWWYVRVVASGNEGWALSGQNDKHWIVCCVNASGVTATTNTLPVVKETPLIGAHSASPTPPTHVSQASALTSQQAPPGETVLQQCARETGGSPGFMDARAVELWKCIERVQNGQAGQLGDRACNEYICIFRLTYVSEGIFSGSGYTLKYRVSSHASKFGNQNITTYGSVLTAENGKEITLHETIGPVGSIFMNTGGPLTGPFGTGANSYIVLRLPKETTAPNENNSLSVASRPCQTASSGLITCELKWKTVEVKFNTISRSGAFRSDGTETTAPQNRRGIKGAGSEKIVFGENGDVYVFSGRSEGFVYKMDLEIDFVANPSRSPKDALGERLLSGETCMPKSYRGRTNFKDYTLTLSLAEENTCDWNLSYERTLQIRFAQDFSSCSVVGFSVVEMNVKPDGSAYLKQQVNLEKPVECRIYSAK